jgi:RNA polymerase sigma factor (sigma-70 family)
MPVPSPWSPADLPEWQLAELIAGFKEGDKSSIKTLICSLNRKLIPFLQKCLGSGPIAHLTDDIIQEAWLRAYARRGDYDPARARFDTWVCRIAINAANDALRKLIPEIASVEWVERHRPLKVGDSLPIDPSDADRVAIVDTTLRDGLQAAERESAEATEWLDRNLRDILKTLPPEDQKMLLFFAYYRGDDWQRAYAELTGINRSTLRSRFRRVLREIRYNLATQGWALEAGPGDHQGVRVELEEPRDELRVGEMYRLAVKIDATTATGVKAGSGPVGLMVLVSGKEEEVSVDPPSHHFTLEAGRAAEPLTFDVRPLQAGRIVIQLTIFTAREFKLRQKLSVVLPLVVPEPSS